MLCDSMKQSNHMWKWASVTTGKFQWLNDTLLSTEILLGIILKETTQEIKPPENFEWLLSFFLSIIPVRLPTKLKLSII